jgi:hypothetical protein
MIEAVVAVAPAAVVIWVLLLAAMLLAIKNWGRRMVQPRPLSLISMLVAVVAAVALWLRLDFNVGKTPTIVHGQNTHSALILLSIAGGSALLYSLISSVRQHAHLWRVVCLQAALLAVGLGLLGSDSARVTERRTGGLIEDTTTVSTFHLWPLYLLWGIPLAVLGVQAWRLRRS